jgi:hypothetical protein
MLSPHKIASPSTPAQGFNDDLLLTDEASSSFPNMFPVLDFPELTALFSRYNASANGSKHRLRQAALAAILLGVFALLGASTQPLLEVGPEGHFAIIPTIVIVLSATAGLLSILISAFGVFNSKYKRIWLESRLMTERLRQFQFQMLALHSTSILETLAGRQSIDQFYKLRRQWLSKFRLDYENHLSGKLTEILDDEVDEQFLLHESEAPGSKRYDDSALEELFEAYRILRIKHQLQFANYKLSPERLDLPRHQVLLLGGITLTCIVIVFFVHFAISISFINPVLEALARNHAVHVLVVWTAIIALAARTFEEGLQPTRELERYTAYKARLGRLLAYFDEVSTLRQKVRIMTEVELAIYQEMRGFLKTNHEARFTI